MNEASDSLTALQRVAAAQTAPVLRFNTELVRSAWSAVQRRHREARRAARVASRSFGGDYENTIDYDDSGLSYAYIDQLWTDHIIVRVGDGSEKFLRVPFSVDAPGTLVEHVKFSTPEVVRMAYVAASRAGGISALQNVLGWLPVVANTEAVVELAARVRTQRGVERYGKPLGSLIQPGAGSGDKAAPTRRPAAQSGSQLPRAAARAASPSRPAVLKSGTSDKGSDDDKESASKSGKSKSVFGDISSKAGLSNALRLIYQLPGGRRGEAAAEIVLAAQALGMTSLVPVSIKRLYREWIAQSKSKKN